MANITKNGKVVGRPTKEKVRMNIKILPKHKELLEKHAKEQNVAMSDVLETLLRTLESK